MTDCVWTTHKQHQEGDYDLQRAIELSLSDTHTIANHISSADTLSLKESKLLVEGFTHFTAHYDIDIPFVMIQICFHYFYIEVSMKQLEEMQHTTLGSRLIFSRVCGIEHAKTNVNSLQMVLTHWRVRQEFEYHREHIIECVRTCIRRDNAGTLQAILRCLYQTIYDDMHISSDSESEADGDSWNACPQLRMNEVIGYINYAAKCGAFKCIELLLQNPIQIDWTTQLFNPVVLYNAVKYKRDNLNLIHFIVDCLEMIGIRFVCDDVMEEIIRYDVVSIAKRIVSNRWHEINDSDVAFAKVMNLKCDEWITERIRQKAYYYDCVNDYGSEYDEW
eukprot:37505_1